MLDVLKGVVYADVVLLVLYSGFEFHVERGTFYVHGDTAEFTREPNPETWPYTQKVRLDVPTIAAVAIQVPIEKDEVPF